MATFSYTSMGGGSATVSAPDRASALRELRRRGVTPTSITAVSGPASSAGVNGGGVATSEQAMPGGRGRAPSVGSAPDRSGGSMFSRAMSRAERASFIRELGTAVQAGLPLVQALRTIARQGRNDRQRRVLETIIGEVEHGRSLAESLAACGDEFGDLVINMVRAGEASGKLEEVLQQAADLLDQDVKLRRSILLATLYPMILAGLLTIAVIVIVTFIVPRVLEPIKGQLLSLPWPTRVVQGVAEFFGGYWWAIAPAILIAVMGARALLRDRGFRLSFDEFLLRVPVLGRLLRDVAVARFTRTLGTLTSAGVPILQSLRITKGTLGNTAMERVIDDVTEQVAGGRTIAEPMEKSGYFPPMLVQIVNLGERSGRLDEMLRQAAKAFEDRTEQSVKVFTTALPPVLVVLLAGVVGFVVLAILLPLLEFQEALK